VASLTRSNSATSRVVEVNILIGRNSWTGQIDLPRINCTPINATASSKQWTSFSYFDYFVSINVFRRGLALLIAGVGRPAAFRTPAGG
jgi:hypothetical protein